jgi:hypothetical protein
MLIGVLADFRRLCLRYVRFSLRLARFVVAILCNGHDSPTPTSLLCSGPA